MLSPKTEPRITVENNRFIAEYTHAKWPFVKDKHTKQSQQCIVYIWTGLDDECKIVMKLSVIKEIWFGLPPGWKGTASSNPVGLLTDRGGTCHHPRRGV